MLYQPPPGQTSIDPHVKIYGMPIQSVKNFTYLGSTVASDNTVDVEINRSIHVASGALEGLWKRVCGACVTTWYYSLHNLKVYKATVLPIILFSAETYTLYRRLFRKLSQAHLRHLRHILRIS